MYTDRKLIIAGDIIHLYEYSKSIQYDYKKRLTPKEFKTNTTASSSSNSQERSKSNLYRAKKAIRLLLQSNAFQYRNISQGRIRPQFYTFTFAENIVNLTQANKRFKKFIQRLNHYVKTQNYTILRYLCVPEFQERGAVHYHCVFFNLPFARNILSIISRTWGYGFVFVRSVKSVRQLANYVAKYITQEAQDKRLLGQKSYFTSKGLYKPKIIKNPCNVDFLIPYLGKASYVKSFQSDTFTTKYSCFNTPVDNQLYKIAIQSTIEL